ncbi:MAG: hypothetical protein KJ561_04490 [Nanoarchaeota archaeon]|nr:hypothetical protein [Nanoarchaeota archaeon]
MITKVKRIILDTNIYEFILRYLEKDRLKRFVEKNVLIVYGLDVIRKELREIPKSIKVKAPEADINNLRIALLSLYDLLVGSHQYKLTEEVLNLANKYFTVYKSIGGFASREEMVNDFCIVSCAALHSLDIVVSEDNRTLLSDKAILAYKSVNSLEKIRTPEFIGFNKIKELLGGVALD